MRVRWFVCRFVRLVERLFDVLFLCLLRCLFVCFVVSCGYVLDCLRVCDVFVVVLRVRCLFASLFVFLFVRLFA